MRKMIHAYNDDDPEKDIDDDGVGKVISNEAKIFSSVRALFE